MNSPFLSNQKVRLIVWETLSMWVDLFPNYQVNKTEEEKESEKDKVLIPKTEDVKMEEEEEETEESKEKRRRPKKRRQVKKS